MLVSRNVFPVVSALQSIAFIHIFLADQNSCSSYVGSVYRVRSLAEFIVTKTEPPGNFSCLNQTLQSKRTSIPSDPPSVRRISSDAAG